DGHACRGCHLGDASAVPRRVEQRLDAITAWVALRDGGIVVDDLAGFREEVAAYLVGCQERPLQVRVTGERGDASQLDLVVVASDQHLPLVPRDDGSPDLLGIRIRRL